MSGAGFDAPEPDDALSFDEVEAAGLDGTLRSVGAPYVITVTVGPAPDAKAFVDELLGQISEWIEDTDIEGVPVTYGVKVPS